MRRPVIAAVAVTVLLIQQMSTAAAPANAQTAAPPPIPQVQSVPGFDITADNLAGGAGDRQNLGTNSGLNVFDVQRLLFFWNEIEPQPGQFSFQEKVNLINRAVREKKQKVVIDVWVGPDAPAWIYTAPYDVEPIRIKDSDRGDRVPYYEDETYIELYHDMYRAVLGMIESLDEDVRPSVLAVSANVGSTNDLKPYGGQLVEGQDTERYTWSYDQWLDYCKKIWTEVDRIFDTPKGRDVRLLYNVGQYNRIGEVYTPEAVHRWAAAHLRHPWFKVPTSGYRAVNNGERSAYHGWMKDFLTEPVLDSEGRQIYLGSRAEFHAEANGLLKLFHSKHIIPSLMYWQALYAMHWGLTELDYVGINAVFDEYLHDPATRPLYDEAFRFVSRYAGQMNPNRATSGFSALRSGLDVADTQRFPTSEYGDLTDLEQRAKNIVAAHADRGATYEGPIRQAYGSVKGLANDAKWDVFEGNYERFVTHLDHENGVGYWHVNEKAQVYGKYALGVTDAPGRNTMSFDVENRMFPDTGYNAARRDVDVRVVYLDRGTSSWQLRYDASGEPDELARTVTKTDTGQWREITVRLTDAHFANRSRRGSDLYLVNPDGETNVFHMVEVTLVGAQQALDPDPYASGATPRLMINHQLQDPSLNPTLLGKRVYVPATEVLRAFGARISRSDGYWHLSVRVFGKHILLRRNLPFALVDGKPVKLDGVLLARQDTELLPLTFLTEVLDGQVAHVVPKNLYTLAAEAPFVPHPNLGLVDPESVSERAAIGIDFGDDEPDREPPIDLGTYENVTGPTDLETIARLNGPNLTVTTADGVTSVEAHTRASVGGDTVLFDVDLATAADAVVLTASNAQRVRDALIHVYVDPTDPDDLETGTYLGAVRVDATGSWSVFADKGAGTKVAIPAGRHTIALMFACTQENATGILVRVDKVRFMRSPTLVANPDVPPLPPVESVDFDPMPGYSAVTDVVAAERTILVEAENVTRVIGSPSHVTASNRQMQAVSYVGYRNLTFRAPGDHVQVLASNPHVGLASTVTVFLDPTDRGDPMSGTFLGRMTVPYTGEGFKSFTMQLERPVDAGVHEVVLLFDTEVNTLPATAVRLRVDDFVFAGPRSAGTP
ncbi:carbohydrate-binding protein [Micromonospora coxensis]|uniref:Carbohydrate binding module (Family 6) n=1 Tax=Micromonospora coxensis TaxID=356852 RepID=A0A1C5GXD0_9ACTN|nr:carbohydrate-binding protein [Micromonospora coxensis]SCG37801.1 Carbohydrate binding module (family 6) [Micromonospora coxensis]